MSSNCISNKARMKTQHKLAIQSLCALHNRSFADCRITVCENRKTIFVLECGEIPPSSASGCFVEQRSVLSDSKFKTSLFPAIVIPHNWKVCMVEHNQVWIAKTRLSGEGKRMEYRFALVLCSAQGELLNSWHEVDNLPPLTRQEAKGEWFAVPGEAFQSAFTKVKDYIGKSTAKLAKVNGKLLVGISYDRAQLYLRETLNNPSAGLSFALDSTRNDFLLWIANHPAQDRECRQDVPKRRIRKRNTSASDASFLSGALHSPYSSNAESDNMYDDFESALTAEDLEILNELWPDGDAVSRLLIDNSDDITFEGTMLLLEDKDGDKTRSLASSSSSSVLYLQSRLRDQLLARQSPLQQLLAVDHQALERVLQAQPMQTLTARDMYEFIRFCDRKQHVLAFSEFESCYTQTTMEAMLTMLQRNETLLIFAYSYLKQHDFSSAQSKMVVTAWLSQLVGDSIATNVNRMLDLMNSMCISLHFFLRLATGLPLSRKLLEVWSEMSQDNEEAVLLRKRIRVSSLTQQCTTSE